MRELLFQREKGGDRGTWIEKPIKILKMESKKKTKHMEAKALQTI